MSHPHDQAADTGGVLDPQLQAIIEVWPSLSREQRTAVAAAADAVISRQRTYYAQIPVKAIKANALNPRKDWSRAKLPELAASFERDGMLQPIIVRRMNRPGKYQLICGERRLRAASLLQRDTIAALVAERMTMEDVIRWVVVENTMRVNLSPIEIAHAIKMLDGEGYTRQQSAALFGKKEESWATNMTRLLQLPGEIQDAIDAGKLAATAGRALIKYAKNHAIMREIIKDMNRKPQNWQRRSEVERRAEAIAARTSKPGKWDNLMILDDDMAGAADAEIVATYNRRFPRRERATVEILRDQRYRRRKNQPSDGAP